jgi:excisionase family DNA binding protein
MTVGEAAELARVCPRTITNWIQRGDLPAARVGPKLLRVLRADVEAMLAPRRPVVKP